MITINFIRLFLARQERVSSLVSEKSGFTYVKLPEHSLLSNYIRSNYFNRFLNLNKEGNIFFNPETNVLKFKEK